MSNNPDSGDLRRLRPRYEVTVKELSKGMSYLVLFANNEISNVIIWSIGKGITHCIGDKEL